MTGPTRAVRNNNPGNLERGAAWAGLSFEEEMTPEQRSEHRFCVFCEPKWGFRALATVLRNYNIIHGFNTVAGIIGRFAPPKENDVSAYVKAVCDGLGVEADKPLNLDDAVTLQSLCRAIAVHESGGWMFQTPDLERGVAMAIGPKAELRIA